MGSRYEGRMLNTGRVHEAEKGNVLPLNEICVWLHARHRARNARVKRDVKGERISVRSRLMLISALKKGAPAVTNEGLAGELVEWRLETLEENKPSRIGLAKAGLDYPL